MRAFPVILSFVAAATAHAADHDPWTIVTGPTVHDEALRIAIDDLIDVAAGCGMTFSFQSTGTLPDGDVILVGAADRNPLVADYAPRMDIPTDEQGYAIRSFEDDGRRVMVVAGGSVIGDTYGVYWLWDRMRVHRALPDIDVVRCPAMGVRLAAAWGRRGSSGSTKGQMRNALRYSVNWVSGPNALDLIPWDSEPEALANAATRDTTRDLIAYAHALHMKYFAFTNDFTYHPSLLTEDDATISPCDPNYWKAVKGKYRKLLTALPELDGVEICNDDISGFWDNYAAYDVMHETPECDWPYSKRFRTFVRSVHEVVSEEFNKTYFHFTWGLSAHEQHVQPAVYREIFDDTVPTDNLYLIPKVTSADRWWHQPYNSTFNQTAHDTIVCFETMNYYEGGSTGLFPTFAGEYYQNGLQTFLLPENSNLRGAAVLAGLAADGWDTTSAYIYTLYRLMWDPYEDVRTIARDFCAIHFGSDAAEAMAEIYLLSPHAYKYGLHIEPVSYGQFNSFIHMRVGTFPVEGYPSIDGGREHLEFLRRIYLRCEPWREETLDDLAHGLDTAREMEARFNAARGLINDASTVTDLENRLAMTRALIATNVGYVRLMFAFFDYLDDSTDENYTALKAALEDLTTSRGAFAALPGFSYNLFGVDQLVENASAAAVDVASAKAALARAPTRSQLEATVADQQRRYAEVLAQHEDEAVHFADFEAMIDGRDILSISGEKHSIEHIRWDGPEVKVMTIRAPLPEAEVTVVPKDLYSRPLHPFVLEQPTAENGYTVRIYLDDLPGGKDWVKCELYYVPRPPHELGLELPWKE